MITNDDADLILMLGGEGPCSLNTSPGVNWVEKAGGLPGYICNIAKDVMEKGHPKGSAIAIAVGTVKRWARGGDNVTAKTRAKAAAAVAAWEALKARNKAGHLVKASREDGTQFVLLTDVGSFSTDLVRRAFERQQNAKWKQHHADQFEPQPFAPSLAPDTDQDDAPDEDDHFHAIERPEPYAADQSGADDSEPDGDADDSYDADNDGDQGVPCVGWIRELWTDFVIIEVNDDDGDFLAKIPYTVSGLDVNFGTPVAVQVNYTEVPSSALDDDDKSLLAELTNHSALNDFLTLSRR